MQSIGRHSWVQLLVLSLFSQSSAHVKAKPFTPKWATSPSILPESLHQVKATDWLWSIITVLWSTDQMLLNQKRCKKDVRVPFLNWRIRQASLTPMTSACDQHHKQANQSLNTQSQQVRQVVVCKGWFSGMKEDSSHFWGRNSCLPLVSRLPWSSIDSFDQLIRNFPANRTLVKKPIQFEISLSESWKSIILIMARQDNTKLWRHVKNMRLIEVRSALKFLQCCHLPQGHLPHPWQLQWCNMMQRIHQEN